MSGTIAVDAASADWPGPEPALLEGEHQSTDQVTAVGFFVAFGAFLLIVASIPNYATSVWAPKAAVLVVLGAGGIPLLITRAIGRGWRVRSRSEMWAARMALVFLGIGLISVAGAARPVLSLVGLYDLGTGWFFFASVAGCWALGTALNRADRRLVQSLIITGAVVTAVVSVLQLVVGLNGHGILEYQGVPDGLQGNPIFSCAILAATLSLIQPRFRDESSRWGWIAVICGIGLGIGGERLPALASLLFYIWLIYSSWRQQQTDPQTGALRSGLIFSGLGLASTIGGSLLAKAWNGLGVVGHLASSTSDETFGQRIDAWKAGGHAIAHHPFFGAGPGQFRAASQAYFTVAGQRQNSGSVFDDAHNILIEITVGTGLVGLVAFLGFLGFGLRHRRGPFLAFALMILLVELAEPLNVAITPLAFLALGAAVLAPGPQGSSPPDRPPPNWLRYVCGAAALLALVPGVALVIGDISLVQATGHYEIAQDGRALAKARWAERLLSPWPEPAVLYSQIRNYQAIGDYPNEIGSAIDWAKTASQRDPTSPVLLYALANYQLYDNRYSDAIVSARKSVNYAPWYALSLGILGNAYFLQHHTAEADIWIKKSLAANPNQPRLVKMLKGQCTVQHAPAGNGSGPKLRVDCPNSP
jgi:O-antigen ligase